VNEPPDSLRTSLTARDSELPSIASAPVAPATKRGRRIALAIVLLLSFLAVCYMAAPLWVGLVLGTVMAFTGQPLYRRLATLLGQRRALASFITTFIGAILTLAGGGVAIYVIANELFKLGKLVNDKIQNHEVESFVNERLAPLLHRVNLSEADLTKRMTDELGAASAHAAEAAGVILTTTTSAALSLLVAAFTMFYVLLEWSHIAVRLERLLPLDPRHTRALVLEFRDVGRSAFIGSIATGIVQGTFAGIGFAIAGVDQPVTLGVVTALASFVPFIGTAIVWIPMGAIYIALGSYGKGTFIWVWGSIIVMAVSDYVVRPRLVGSKGQGHPLLMLIALLGGIAVFGLAGLIAGPVIMSLFLAIARIYEREVSSDTGPISAVPSVPSVQVPSSSQRQNADAG
jgi:predicted PurR-regulated permease PerM